MADFSNPEVLSGAAPSGEKIAFTVVYKEYYSIIYAFCLSLIRTKEDARDITSETFIKFYKLYDRFGTIANMRAFLYVTSRNACFDFLRHKNMAAAKMLDVAKQQEIEFYQLINDELDVKYYAALKNSFNKLPKRHKEVLQKQFWEELDSEETAQQLNISVKNVWATRSRAISLLRELLRSDSIEYSNIFLLSVLCSTWFL